MTETVPQQLPTSEFADYADRVRAAAALARTPAGEPALIAGAL